VRAGLLIGHWVTYAVLVWCVHAIVAP
jgi:hypothetical protein